MVMLKRDGQTISSPDGNTPIYAGDEAVVARWHRKVTRRWLICDEEIKRLRASCLRSLIWILPEE